MDTIAAALFVITMQRLCRAENRLWGFEKVQINHCRYNFFKYPCFGKGFPQMRRND
jgi:hypothetical protein